MEGEHFSYLTCVIRCGIFINLFLFVLLNSVDGHTYFKCKPKYGSMVPVISVEVGDFPPESDGLDDDEI